MTQRMVRPDPTAALSIGHGRPLPRFRASILPLSHSFAFAIVAWMGLANAAAHCGATSSERRRDVQGASAVGIVVLHK